MTPTPPIPARSTSLADAGTAAAGTSHMASGGILPRIRAAASHRSRLVEYRRLFGVCPPLLMKIEETPTMGELDGLVAECGARGQDFTPEERHAVAVRRAELMKGA